MLNILVQMVQKESTYERPQSPGPTSLEPPRTTYRFSNKEFGLEFGHGNKNIEAPNHERQNILVKSNWEPKHVTVPMPLERVFHAFHIVFSFNTTPRLLKVENQKNIVVILPGRDTASKLNRQIPK